MKLAAAVACLLLNLLSCALADDNIVQLPAVNRQTTSVRSADPKTKGKKTLARRSAVRSSGVLCRVASLTRWITCPSVVSAPTFLATTFSEPNWFNVPE